MPEKLDIMVARRHFMPDMGASAARFHGFGRLLVEFGLRVRMIAGFPNSPSDRVPDQYRVRTGQREWIGGIEVLRGWICACPRLLRFTNSAGFASCRLSASLWVTFVRRPFDHLEEVLGWSVAEVRGSS